MNFSAGTWSPRLHVELLQRVRGDGHASEKIAAHLLGALTTVDKQPWVAQAFKAVRDVIGDSAWVPTRHDHVRACGLQAECARVLARQPRVC